MGGKGPQRRDGRRVLRYMRKLVSNGLQGTLTIIDHVLRDTGGNCSFLDGGCFNGKAERQYGEREECCNHSACFED